MVTGASSCEGTCPEQLPLTPFGSTAESNCFTRMENFFVVSSLSNRLTMLDNDQDEHRTLLDGDRLNAPAGLVFISPTTALIPNTGSGKVLKLDLRTGVTSLFANVVSPKGILFDPISNQIAIASEDDRKVFFFNVTDGELTLVNQLGLSGILHLGGSSDCSTHSNST